MQKQKIFLLVIASLLIFYAAQGVFAASGVPTLQNTVKYYFTWGISIAVLLAGISFAVGGVQYIISMHADGKERMLGSILGLVLLLASYVILQTINPAISTLTFNPLPKGTGIFFVKNYSTSPGGGTPAITNSIQNSDDPTPTDTPDYAPAPLEESDTSDVVAEGYTGIEYDCVDPDTAPKLLLWQWNLPDENNNDNEETFTRITCNSQPTPIQSDSSYVMEFEQPGVYFYTKGDCGGVSSDVQNESETISGDFYGNTKSIRIVVPEKDTATYSGIGTVLHASADYFDGGDCDTLMLKLSDDTYQDSECFSVNNNIKAHSLDIFYIPEDVDKAGNGINFYSEPTGWNADEEAGIFTVLGSKINKDEITVINTGDMCFDYTGSSKDQKYMQDYPSFYDRQGSMKINGNYFVKISSANDSGDSDNNDSENADSEDQDWCQTFTDDVTDFGQKSILIPNFQNSCSNEDQSCSDNQNNSGGESNSEGSCSNLQASIIPAITQPTQ